MSQNDCIGKTLKPWPILVDHYRALKNQSRCFYEIDVHLEQDEKKLKEQLDTLFLRRDELNSTSLSISAKAYKKAKKDIESGSNNYKVDIDKS